MRNTTIAMLAGACLAATGATAREPGTPVLMPPGATMGVPLGANPPHQLLLSSRTALSFGQLKDGNGDNAGVDVNAQSTVLQLHWTPGVTILGGSYRAMALLPFVHVDQTLGAPLPAIAHGSDSGFGLGDATISPVNLSWMVRPGVFVAAGLSLYPPTGDHEGEGAINFGANAWGASLDLGYSYLRDGWNASMGLNYFTQGENPDTDYRSGDEVLFTFTALKDLGGYSLGPVGYYRKQVTDDRNDGTAHGGAAAGAAEQLGLGLGYSRRFGDVALNVNVTHDVVAENALQNTKLWVNLDIPLK